jgi:predicted Zn-dependent protease
LSYDRGQELQADQIGALYMARAGYDPNQAIRSHEVLNKAIDAHLANLGQKRGQSSSMSQLMSTHPRHEERVSELQASIKTIPPADMRLEGDGVFAERWLRQTEPVRRLAPAYARYDRALQAFAQAFKADEQGQQALVRQKVAETQRELQAAIQIADQAQFATLQGYLFAVTGRKGEARTAFNRAISLYPGYQPALRALARIDT